MIFTSLGIALLLVVFYLAYQMLTHPVPGLKEALASNTSAPGTSSNAVSNVGSSIVVFLLKLAVLFVMTFAGSHVAARGIQLYHGGAHASTVVRPVAVALPPVESSAALSPRKTSPEEYSELQ